MTARHSMTTPAATAAIEQGCRMLRLPTIRDRFAAIAATAEREHHTYLGISGRAGHRRVRRPRSAPSPAASA